ncbi:MAG: hypothetical protein HXY30_10670 [Pseudorhodoplanes sp.]|nr:hypothetical protein [Pseudorhodoplanes sp.]
MQPDRDAGAVPHVVIRLAISPRNRGDALTAGNSKRMSVSVVDASGTNRFRRHKSPFHPRVDGAVVLFLSTCEVLMTLLRECRSHSNWQRKDHWKVIRKTNGDRGFREIVD